MRFFKKDEPQEPQGPPMSEIDDYRRSVLNAGMPPEVEQASLKEIERIAKMAAGSAEHTIGINYIDYLSHLPWNRASDDCLDLNRSWIRPTMVSRKSKTGCWSTWRCGSCRPNAATRCSLWMTRRSRA